MRSSDGALSRRRLSYVPFQYLLGATTNRTPTASSRLRFRLPRGSKAPASHPPRSTMLHAIFVVPFGMKTSLRFVRATSRLADVRLGIISQDKANKLPDDIQASIVAFQQVDDALNPTSLAEGVRQLAAKMGGRVDRLIGILEQLQEPLAQVREELGIRGMALQTATNFRDKARMKDVLRDNDLPCAAHRLATTAAEALRAADSIGYPMIAKPPDGAGAKNTVRIETHKQLEGYMRAIPPTKAAPLLLEEFIRGKEHSFDTVSVGGQHVFHSISEYYPSPLEVMESPWIQWCVFLPREIHHAEFEDIHAAGCRSLDALGMVTGLSHMEWFRRADGSIAISEVGARPPGAQFTTLLSYAHDTDFYSAWAELVVHERFTPPERKYSCGAVFLRGQGAGQVASISGIEEIKRELGDLIVEARIPEVGTPQASSYEGEGFIILRHEESEVVKKGLAKLLKLVRINLGDPATTARSKA